jgi:hypothetical protein
MEALARKADSRMACADLIRQGGSHGGHRRQGAIQEKKEEGPQTAPLNPGAKQHKEFAIVLGPHLLWQQGLFLQAALRLARKLTS